MSNIDNSTGSCSFPLDLTEEIGIPSSHCENENRCSNPEYYGFLFGWIGTVCQSSVFLVGLVGNLVVVVTVRGTKSLHTTTNCYLVSLAISDLITLVSSVPQVGVLRDSGGNNIQTK